MIRQHKPRDDYANYTAPCIHLALSEVHGLHIPWLTCKMCPAMMRLQKFAVATYQNRTYLTISFYYQLNILK